MNLVFKKDKTGGNEEMGVANTKYVEKELLDLAEVLGQTLKIQSSSLLQRERVLRILVLSAIGRIHELVGEEEE